MNTYLVWDGLYENKEIRLVTTDVDKAINVYLILKGKFKEGPAIDVWKDEKNICEFGRYMYDDDITTAEAIKKILDSRIESR